MACCGKKRQALNQALNNEAALATKPVLQPGSDNNNPAEQAVESTNKFTRFSATVRLLYLQGSTLVINGAATGRRYLFSRSQPIQAVEGRDVEGFLKTGLFRKA